MSDVNMVIITGRLTDMPHSAVTPSGTQVVEFSVAVNRHGKAGDEVSFIGVTVFGRLAGICAQYLGKGSKVLVSGGLRQDKWQDRQTGQNRSIIKITATEVNFLDIADGQDAIMQQAPQQMQMRFARSEMHPGGMPPQPPQPPMMTGDGFGTPFTQPPPQASIQPPPPDPDMPF